MKKIKITAFLIILFSLSFFISGCGCNAVKEIKISSPDQVRQLIAPTAEQVMNSLQNQDYVSLADYIHPQKGVRITAYPPITKDDPVFSAADIRNINDNRSKVYQWGKDKYNQQIALNFDSYYKQYIYNLDYASTLDVFFNPVSNLLPGLQALYPDALLSEYYFYTSQPSQAGWVSNGLHLVFEQKDGKWYLVAIIHE